MSEPSTTLNAEQIAGKYLSFLLEGEEFGLQILKVQEIVGMMPVTRVPKAPPVIRGVVNLRGKVIPVVDLRSAFGQERRDDSEKTCIIVVQVAHGDQQLIMGIIVDEVSEVRDIDAGIIEPPPEFGSLVDTSFILGMGIVGEQVVILLDIDRVLGDEVLTLVNRLAK